MTDFKQHAFIIDEEDKSISNCLLTTLSTNNVSNPFANVAMLLAWVNITIKYWCNTNSKWNYQQCLSQLQIHWLLKTFYNATEMMIQKCMYISYKESRVVVNSMWCSLLDSMYFNRHTPLRNSRIVGLVHCTTTSLYVYWFLNEDKSKVCML